MDKRCIFLLSLVFLPGCYLGKPDNSNCDSCLDAGADKSTAPDAIKIKPDSGIDAKKPDLSPAYVDNDKDGYYSDADCNDGDPKIHPDALEVCNGIDDDCDGNSDNNPIDVGAPCGSGIGECLPGADTCINGQIKCAGAKLPQNELCDGKDNDCNGKTDEDYPDLGKACDEGAGACKQSGHLICNGSATILKCDAKPFKATIEGPPGDSTCNDKIDNDCDGFTDESDSDCNNCATDADCNQGNKCEIAKCLNGVCDRKPFSDGAPCPDDKFCNGIETCKDGKCNVPGVKVTCNDGDQCTNDSCDENKSPHCVNLPKITSNIKEGLQGSLECNDGQDNDCDGKKDLDDKDCRECENDFECVKDTNPCMNYYCDSQYVCKSSPKADNVLCNDGLKCNGSETCQSGKCAEGKPITCPNGPCSIGFCDETQNGKCILVPLAECECLSMADCNDKNECTVDKCDNNKCVHTQQADGATCNDSEFCTVNEKCQGGQCIGTKRDCSPFANACNIANCNEDFDVCEKLPKANGTSCSNGLVCDGNETCQNGLCQSGIPPVCNDNNICTDDVCDPILDKCVFNPKNLSGLELWKVPGSCSDTVDNDCDGKTDYADPDCRQCETNGDCNDFNDCTSDVCDASNNWTCKYTNLSGSACDDNKWCTTNDVCNNGKCYGAARDCSPSGDACNTGICNESLDMCQKSPKPDSTTCYDGLWCTVNDHCSFGTCVSGGDRNCGQGYTCDESSDQCLYKQCDDNGDCNDSNQCTSDSCDFATWTCKFTSLNGSACDDNKWCTTSDVCVNSACTGTQMNCASYGDQCNNGACDEYSHTCKKQPKPNNTLCDDNLWCTIGEYCVSGYCMNGQPRNCSPGTCDESYDKCDMPNNGPGCADGTREGFIDGNTFPNIAGCSGAWSNPGLTNAAYLCAFGWHIAIGASDVASHMPSGKTCWDVWSGSEKRFFATLQPSNGNGYCNTSGTNDIFGCGNYGDPPQVGSCGMLNVFSSEDCNAIKYPYSGAPETWRCGGPGDSSNELITVVKLQMIGGGVICCKN